jgi:ribulose-5-phosphate 4-epimerase/fuculose-1-phosphate aldolase
VAATAQSASDQSTPTSAEERDLRIQLAAAHRLAEKYGMAELIYTHISLRVPGSPTTYLFKPHQLLFEEITASNLVRVDLAGNIVGESQYRVNPAGTGIHGAILEARPDVNCVFHTHSPYAVAVSSIEGGLQPLTQASFRFIGAVAYHDYAGAAVNPVERSRLQEDMGDASVMLMRNHGVLATGETVGEAFIAAYYMERACQFQILAQASGKPLVLPPVEPRPRQRGPGTLSGRTDDAWPALLRMLDKEDPSYRD